MQKENRLIRGCPNCGRICRAKRFDGHEMVAWCVKCDVRATDVIEIRMVHPRPTLPPLKQRPSLPGQLPLFALLLFLLPTLAVAQDPPNRGTEDAAIFTFRPMYD